MYLTLICKLLLRQSSLDFGILKCSNKFSTIHKNTFSFHFGIFYVKTEIWKKVFQKSTNTTPSWGAPHLQTTISKWEFPWWGLQSTLGIFRLLDIGLHHYFYISTLPQQTPIYRYPKSSFVENCLLCILFQWALVYEGWSNKYRTLLPRLLSPLAFTIIDVILEPV